MAKTVADVMKMVKENEVKFVDFRFTDTRGKEQHVTVPVSHFDEDKFSSGHAFDGLGGGVAVRDEVIADSFFLCQLGAVEGVLEVDRRLGIGV